MSTTDTATTAEDTPATVYADPHTDLFHRHGRHAGGDAIVFSRPQAGVFGYRPCPDCFDGAGWVK